LEFTMSASREKMPMLVTSTAGTTAVPFHPFLSSLRANWSNRV
jgi:hypothetical protein